MKEDLLMQNMRWYEMHGFATLHGTQTWDHVGCTQPALLRIYVGVGRRISLLSLKEERWVVWTALGVWVVDTVGLF